MCDIVLDWPGEVLLLFCSQSCDVSFSIHKLTTAPDLCTHASLQVYVCCSQTLDGAAVTTPQPGTVLMIPAALMLSVRQMTLLLTLF